MIILFWSKYENEQNYNDWINKDIEISDFHKLTLYSQKKYNNEVFLYTYQNITNLPKGINIEDADKVYSRALAFEALKRGHNIAHISDIVRIRMASLLKGTITDMDMIALRPLPDIDNFFSSIPAKKTGAMAIKWKENHPPFKIHDNSWNGKALSNFPSKVGKNMEYDFIKLAHRIEQQLEGLPRKDTKGWNYIMWTLKEIARDHKEAKIYEPLYFGPIPAWLGSSKCYSLEAPSRLDGKTELFGYRMPSIEEIINKSYFVAHYFESAFKKADVITDIWDRVKIGSLLNAELEHILSDNWRNELWKLN
tara:strand:+ start:343 stop:1266 length:924 start_codon:yes stop_codon:yes gene_type:complete